MLKVIAACGSGMGSSQIIKMKLEKVISELNQIMNNYPISNIARLDAMRTEEEKKPKAFEEPKIVITETFA